jgi:hypothetical protein
MLGDFNVYSTRLFRSREEAFFKGTGAFQLSNSDTRDRMRPDVRDHPDVALPSISCRSRSHPLNDGGKKAAHRGEHEVSR